MQIYYSKKDFWLGALLWLPMLAAFGLILYTFEPITSMFIVLAIMLISLGFIAWLWFDTKYITKNGQIKVNAGPIYYAPVPIQKIKSIKKTKTWLSSPACSLDRIEISYNKYDSIVISPMNLDGFISDLNAINPSIKVEFAANE